MTKLSLEHCIYALAMTCTIVAVGGQQFSSIIPRTMPLLLRKGLLLPEWWAANEVPEIVVANGAVGAL